MTDLRRTTCKRWVTRSGRRTVCGLDRDHDGLCTWAVIPAFEPEIRDPGPYESADEAMQQYVNWSLGLPVPTEQATRMLINEALAGTGVRQTEFEASYLAKHPLDPILATIIHGWLIHAGR